MNTYGINLKQNPEIPVTIKMFERNNQRKLLSTEDRHVRLHNRQR